MSFDDITRFFGIIIVRLLDKINVGEKNGNEKKNKPIKKIKAGSCFFNKVVSSFENKKKEFEEKKQQDNETLENIKTRYKEKDPKAIEEYCD